MEWKEHRRAAGGGLIGAILTGLTVFGLSWQEASELSSALERQQESYNELIKLCLFNIGKED